MIFLPTVLATRASREFDLEDNLELLELRDVSWSWSLMSELDPTLRLVLLLLLLLLLFVKVRGSVMVIPHTSIDSVLDNKVFGSIDKA